MEEHPCQHRTARFELQVKGRDGSPLRGMEITVRQTSHAFLFGCGVFDAVELCGPCVGPRKDFLMERMESWLKLFNYGTLPFYWGRFEPEEGRTMTLPTLRAAKWLSARNVKLKGHPLCWHTVCAPWLLSYPDGEILRRQINRIRREVSDFKGLINLWDVINEAVIMPEFSKYDNAVTRISKELGRVGLAEEVFSAAREENPGALLLINDFDTSVRYERLIANCLEKGVPIDAIGIQSHQHQGYWGLQKLEKVLARFARFGLPIHFTENTLISGNLMPSNILDLNDYQVEAWPTTPAGEERQAREMQEMYEVLFAHPLVAAITAWDFVDGKWLKAPSGLLRADNSKKPAYYALQELIHKRWHTEERMITDERGRAAFTGYLGKYEYTCGGRKGTFELEKASGICAILL